MNHWVEQLHEVCKISEIASRYCSISKQSNGRYVTKCPFHQEKTASLTIDDKKNIFYCFGCKVGGDSIKFVQLIEKLDFAGACRKIADWHGITLSSREVLPDLQNANLIKEWCVGLLRKNNEVLKYLYSRGLTDETIQKFGIGWFGSQSDFMRFAQKNNLSMQVMESIGLKKNILFLFENRILFPIMSNDRVIGFGARKFFQNDNRCKYINTSESLYFNKKEVLYGFNEIKFNLEKELFIVEGYIDVCMCNQYGIEAVSTLGTAINPQHLQTAWTKADEVSIWFDGDLPGQKASAKIAFESFEVIKPSKILSFINSPAGEDPASFLQAQGDFSQLLLGKEYLADKIWRILQPKKHKNPELSVAAYKKVLSYTDKIQDRDLRSLYVGIFKNKWYEKYSKTKKAASSQADQHAEPKDMYELILLMTIFYHPQIFNDVCDYLLSMDLKPDLHKLREIFLNNASDMLDFDNDNMLQFYVGLCTIQKLNKIAPFTKQASQEELVSGWMEVYGFYCDCVQSGRLSD